jgi:hypothetical protein
MAHHPVIEDETKGAVWHALCEVGFITILSLLPLVAIAYYQYVEQPGALPAGNSSRTLWDFVYNNTAAGQLAFYAVANWAAVAWICGLERKLHIPGRPLFILLCIVGFTYCGILIAITAATNYVPTVAVTFPSGAFYALSIVCYVLLLIFQRLRPPTVEDSNISDVSNLHKKVNALRGDENAE